MRFLFLLIFILNMYCNSAFATDFKEVDFVGATKLNSRNEEVIAHKKDNNYHFRISSTGIVNFENKKTGQTYELFDSKKNPVLVYRIVSDNKKVFYAVFDRKINRYMETTNFALIGTFGNGFKEYITMQTLKDHGWTSLGMRIFIKEKNLIIEGITKLDALVDYIKQPIILNWDDATNAFSLVNQKSLIDQENSMKKLKEEDFTFMDIKLGGAFNKITEKYGSPSKEKAVEKIGRYGKNKRMFTLYYYKDNMSFYVDNESNNIWGINVANREFYTPRGFAVGLTKEKMIELYGTEYTIKNLGRYISYIYSANKQKTVLTNSNSISFIFDFNNKAVMISIDKFDELK